MPNHEVVIRIQIIKATNVVIEAKKQPNSSYYPKSMENLLRVLASDPKAMDIFRELQNGK